MASMIKRGIASDETRMRMLIVPQKTDKSKIYIVSLVDHAAADGLSILQTTAMMQDNWLENPVPLPDRELLSTGQFLRKLFDLTKVLIPTDKRIKSIKNIGKGAKGEDFHYKLSGPIQLSELKKQSKQLGVTINDLFMGAIVTAYSKLDLPEERRPSEFMSQMAVGLANKKTITDDF